MTLIAAWTRRLGSRPRAPKVEELVIASDSRLTFGQCWDACPKVFAMPRSDAVIAFCGSTFYGYPVVEQMRSAVAMFRKSATRGLDVVHLIHFLVDFLNEMLASIHTPPNGKDFSISPAETRFLFAGYSWIYKKFFIWRIRYSEKRKQYFHASHHRQGARLLAFDGDAGADTKKLLKMASKLTGRRMYKNGLDSSRSYCNYEPLETIRDISRAASFDSVGGPPQLLKVYQHMNTQPIAVFWPSRTSGMISLLGRPLLNFEMANYPVLDLDTLESVRFDAARRETPEQLDASTLGDSISADGDFP
jgi:hypothetical protein